jgi:hypothetical protein
VTTKPAGPVSIEAARALPGLRLLVLQGVPSPWSQAARAILRVKQLPYTLVHRSAEDAPGALEAWTGQASFPAAMYEQERAHGWAEIPLLAERLAPSPHRAGRPPPAPSSSACHEICGDGAGWCRRLESAPPACAHAARLDAGWLGGKYGYSLRPRRRLGLRTSSACSASCSRSRAHGGTTCSAPSRARLTLLGDLGNLIPPPELLPLLPRLRPMFTFPDPAVTSCSEERAAGASGPDLPEYLGLPVVL